MENPEGILLFQNLKPGHRLAIDFGEDFFPILTREGVTQEGYELNAFLDAPGDQYQPDRLLVLTCCLNFMDRFLDAVLAGTIGLRLVGVAAYRSDGTIHEKTASLFQCDVAIDDLYDLRKIVFEVRRPDDL